jgi:hypothetical protein
MDVQEQLTKHAAEIGELKGKIDALATKDFVRRENASLLKEISEKIDKQTSDIQNEINKNREFRTRVTAIGTIIAVALSVAVAAINAYVGAVGVGIIQI